jgi:hypothetical protein
MKLVESEILKKYPEIIFGFNTRDGLNRKEPYFFNVSKSVGDDEIIVDENRAAFLNRLGLDYTNVVIQKQVHSDIVTYVTGGGIVGESDAMITDKPGLGLAISVADCTPIFIYDPANKVIAGVHSGWRGTEKQILLKTLEKLVKDFHVNPQNLIVYIGPCISQKKYEVGEEVAFLFDEKYWIKNKNKYLLSVGDINYDMLINLGIPSGNIEYSQKCTYENNNLHSYRRDGQKSGRSWGIIAMKNNFQK